MKEELVTNIRAGIKEEIKAEMKPLEEKTANIEKVTVAIGDEVKDLAKKLALVEDELASVKEKAMEKQKESSSRTYNKLY